VVAWRGRLNAKPLGGKPEYDVQYTNGIHNNLSLLVMY
jgi:hypothetical protein